ncbi:MAG: hypothetical protein KF724_06365 [Phycisphaeraceae bacterium]|nr:hypothetical protein [Phycisphaeraceae bacterium]
MSRRAGSVLADGAPPGALEARRIRDFGGHPRGVNDPRPGAGAWLVSGALHLGLAILAFLVTWTVVQRAWEEEAPLVTLMDFHAPRFDPLEITAPPTVEASTAPLELSAPTAVPAADLAGLLERVVEITPDDPLARTIDPLVLEPEGRTATLAGLRATNAQRIVYVVDASGSLVGTFPAIAAELAKSLRRLDPRQSFAVILAQRGRALMVPPGRLMPASDEQVRRTVEWIETRVFPTGGSNPLPALDAAMKLEPDLIFFLSAGMTGAGEYEMGPDEFVAALERLNPVVSRSGRRKARIQCVAFLNRDAARLLERVSAAHGGPDSFRYLSREDLGLEPGRRGPDGAPVLE